MNNLESIASEVVKATLSYARDELIQEAQKGLKSTRNDYINGISAIYMESPLKGKITLEGRFPIMLEEGYTGFDMKQGFKQSPKIKLSKDGKWYLTIPYRHRTSGEVNVMPNNIKSRVTKLKNREVLKDAIIEELGYKRETSHAGYQWHSTKYSGLQRIVKQYDSGKKHSQYLTFRRVGEQSDPRSWQHPGFKGLHAFNRVPQKAEAFFYDYLEESL